MKTSYITYLSAINNSLIRGGVHLPIEIKEDMSISEIESVIAVLEPFCYFNDVLTLCDSAYAKEVVGDCKAKLYTDVVKEEVLAKYHESFDTALRLLYADRESPMDKKVEPIGLADYLSKYNKTTDIESLAVSVSAEEGGNEATSTVRYNDIFAIKADALSVYDSYDTDDSDDFDYSDEDVEEEAIVEQTDSTVVFDDYSEDSEEFNYDSEEEVTDEDDEFDYSDDEELVEESLETSKEVDDLEDLIEEDTKVATVPSVEIESSSTDEDEDFDYDEDELDSDEDFDYDEDELDSEDESLETSEQTSDVAVDEDEEDFDYSDDDLSDDSEDDLVEDDDEDTIYDDDMGSEDDSVSEDSITIFDTPTAQSTVSPAVVKPVKEDYEKTAETIVGIVGYGENLAKKLVNSLKSSTIDKK